MADEVTFKSLADEAGRLKHADAAAVLELLKKTLQLLAEKEAGKAKGPSFNQAVRRRRPRADRG